MTTTPVFSIQHHTRKSNSVLIASTFVSTYHMVTVKLLHDRGFIQKLDALPHARRLVDRLDGHPRLWFILDHSLGDALVHHPKRALPQLLVQGDFLSGHLPLVWHVHCHATAHSRSIQGENITRLRCSSIAVVLTLSSAEVFRVDRRIKDTIAQSVVIPVGTHTVKAG